MVSHAPNLNGKLQNISVASLRRNSLIRRHVLIVKELFYNT
jgi:hypothetical protein